MSHPSTPHRPYSFDADVIIEELYNWPLSLNCLSDSHTIQYIMTGIRDCCLCIITDGNIYPESKCMRDMTVFEGLMNQLIALGYVQPHVIRNYSRLMEVAIRATLCDENPKVLQRQYKHRLEMLPYFD